MWARGYGPLASHSLASSSRNTAGSQGPAVLFSCFSLPASRFPLLTPLKTGRQAGFVLANFTFADISVPLVPSAERTRFACPVATAGQLVAAVANQLRGASCADAGGLSVRLPIPDREEEQLIVPRRLKIMYR